VERFTGSELSGCSVRSVLTLEMYKLYFFRAVTSISTMCTDAVAVLCMVLLRRDGLGLSGELFSSPERPAYGPHTHWLVTLLKVTEAPIEVISIFLSYC
jgi:hypothetical protein